MKRALTGIAAAAIVLGTAAPMAFADSSSSALTAAGQKSFVFNGQTVSNPYIMTGVDSGNTTSFAPIYYFDQLLNDAGITATWNGNTHTWALSDSSLDASTVAANIAGGLGTGNTTITLNGTPIKKINTQVAQDPAAKKGVMTTYFPVYYVQSLFEAIGINAVWNGSTGLTVTTAQPGLSVKDTGSTIGDGTATNPYVNASGTSQTIAATLTDASGNPVANATLDLTITAQSAPSIAQGTSYSTLSAGSSDNTWTTTVTTDSTGVATFTVNGEGSYAITITGTGSESNDSATVYVANGDGNPVITPSAANPAISTASNSTAGLVPLTVTLPTAASNQAVTFYVATSSDAVFTNSSGQEIDATVGTSPSPTYKAYTAYTDANGQATVYLNSFTANQATVYVEAGSVNNSFAPADASPNEAVINYQSPAVAATTASALTLSAQNPPSQLQAGTDGQTPVAYVDSLSGIAASTSTPVFVAPLSSSADATDTEQKGTSVTYNLAFASGQDLSDLYVLGSTGAPIQVAIPSGASTTQNVQITASLSGGSYTWYVNGTEVDINGTSTAASTNAPLFGFVPSAAGAVTITSGSASATATFTAASGYDSYVSYVTPGSTSVPVDGSTNISFTVYDTNGNPVVGQMVPIAFNPVSDNGLWLTAVNGTTISSTINTGSTSNPSYSTESTPIPLFDAADLGAGIAPAYTAVSDPGVASGSTSGSGPIFVETDTKGNVELTFGSQDVPYWVTNASSGDVQPAFTQTANGSAATNAGGVSLYTDYGLDKNHSTDGVVYIGSGSSYSTAVGSISW